jgi:hypothetical protein
MAMSSAPVARQPEDLIHSAPHRRTATAMDYCPTTAGPRAVPIRVARFTGLKDHDEISINNR